MVKCGKKQVSCAAAFPLAIDSLDRRRSARGRDRRGAQYREPKTWP
jgi:hypothetical protein